jgi:hypothetical protein
VTLNLVKRTVNDRVQQQPGAQDALRFGPVFGIAGGISGTSAGTPREAFSCIRCFLTNCPVYAAEPPREAEPINDEGGAVRRDTARPSLRLAATRWYCTHVSRQNGSGTTDANPDREAIARLTTARDRALREHLIRLQSEPAVDRFTALLAALSFDPRQQYVAMRAMQLHVGATAPGDGAIMHMDAPAEDPAAAWETEFLAAVHGCMTAASKVSLRTRRPSDP